jgi:exodeoxyribonuclease VII small subunit
MSEVEPGSDMTAASFEEEIGRLEAIAQRLEHPDTPLEEAVALYEEGVRLARLCADRLEAAELKVSELRPGEPGE